MRKIALVDINNFKGKSTQMTLGNLVNVFPASI